MFPLGRDFIDTPRSTPCFKPIVFFSQEPTPNDHTRVAELP